MAQMRLDFDAAPRPVLPPAQRVRTSIAAAEAIADMAGTLRGRVLEWITWQENGATREEIADALNLKLQTVCGRCNELLKMGLIFDSGRTRLTSSGRSAVVLQRKLGA